MNILALNAGSSSLKFRFGAADEEPLFKGSANGFGGSAPRLKIADAAGTMLSDSTPNTLHTAATTILQFVKSNGSQLAAIGHRFVHGGPRLQAHRRIDPEVRAQLNAASAFAPLHNPPALDVLALAETAFPDSPQIACLDTAFHAHMPETAKRLPLPNDQLEGGLHRYGFHGLSCESILRQLGKPPSRLVIAHLGGGASVTAVREGSSVDTTMGLTPDGGVMMETRGGDIDPGLLVYLLRRGETADSLETLLNKNSGIAGVSGHGGDLRDVRAADDASSKLALDMFVMSIAKAIAGMATVLGGLDLLIFTGGIGEHDPAIRSAIVSRLSWISAFDVSLLPAREEEIIQRHTADLIK